MGADIRPLGGRAPSRPPPPSDSDGALHGKEKTPHTHTRGKLYAYIESAVRDGRNVKANTTHPRHVPKEQHTTSHTHAIQQHHNEKKNQWYAYGLNLYATAYRSVHHRHPAGSRLAADQPPHWRFTPPAG